MILFYIFQNNALHFQFCYECIFVEFVLLLFNENIFCETYFIFFIVVRKKFLLICTCVFCYFWYAFWVMLIVWYRKRFYPRCHYYENNNSLLAAAAATSVTNALFKDHFLSGHAASGSIICVMLSKLVGE